MQKEHQSGQFEELAQFLAGVQKTGARGKAGAEPAKKAEGGLADLGEELSDSEVGEAASPTSEAPEAEEEAAEADADPDAESQATSPAFEETPPLRGGGGAGVPCQWLGAALLFAGIALGALPQINLVTVLAEAGFTANLLAIAGIVLLATAQVLRTMRNAAERADRSLTRQLQATDALRDYVDSLAGERGAPRTAAADGGEATAALRRLDEKVNNLTRATKMYGKPLMELAGQVAESAVTLNHIRAQVDSIAEQATQGLNQLGNTLGERLQAVETGVAAIETGAVKQGLDQLETATRKLETTTQKGFERLKTEDPAVPRVEQKLDASTRALQEALADLRNGDLSKLDGAVRDIQRDLQTLAANVTNVQTTLRNRPPAAAAAAPAAPATPTAPAPVPAPAAPSAAPAPSTTPGSSILSSDAQAGVAQNAPGTHNASSKNVLGAIAKLKQMKS